MSQPQFTPEQLAPIRDAIVNELVDVFERNSIIRHSPPITPGQPSPHFFVIAPMVDETGHKGCLIALNRIHPDELAEIMANNLPPDYCRRLISSLNIVSALKSRTDN